VSPQEKVARMVPPESLRIEEYQHWSRGRGVDVWAMLCASIVGDLNAIKDLVARDPGLIDCEYEYYKPIRFAVREGHRHVVEYLIAHGADPMYEAGDSLPELARDRGHSELAEYLDARRAERFRVDPEAEVVAEAIRSHDRDRVQQLIEASPELIHSADQRGNQPLHWAVMTRQMDLIDWLLGRGADINAVRPDGLRPIHITNGDYHYRGWRDVPDTALQRHEFLIGYLLARGASYDINVATKLGDLQRVRELIDEDPSLISQVPPYSYYTGSPLRNAAGAGHNEVVKLLLDRGADINQPEPGVAPHGGALHSALSGRHWDVVKLLLDRGANPNAEVESSGNCLFMAKHVNAPKEIIELLASYGAVMGADLADIETLAAMLHANPNLKVGPKGGLREMELILRYQPDLLKRVPDPTPWWSDAQPDSPEQARWAIERGLDPNRPNWLGQTLLHRCAGKGNIAVAEVLLEHGADINALETDALSTPLDWAMKKGKTEMVEWLLSRGATRGVDSKS
jgi:ankyrin repeat protein